ncbi:MAG: hypothetical protein IKY56_01850 [Alistipes sp.]|nr:hypothetical protein [Alistipes sp.]
MKRVMMLCAFLMSVCALYAQSVTFEDVQYNPDNYINQTIEAYKAVDGNVYHVGDVVIIGKPSGGDMFKPAYNYIEGSESLHSGKLKTDRATIINLYLRKTKSSSREYVLCANLRINRKIAIVQIDNALTSKEIFGKDETLSTPVTTEQNYVADNTQSSQMMFEEQPKKKTFGSLSSKLNGATVVDADQRRGYGGIALFDVGFDFANVGALCGVTVINGFHFNNNWYLGGGIGVLGFVGGYNSSVSVPIFAHGQYTFYNSMKFTPYVSAGLGMAISSYVGSYLNVAGGVAIKLNHETQRLIVGMSLPIDTANGIGLCLQLGYSF